MASGNQNFTSDKARFLSTHPGVSMFWRGDNSWSNVLGGTLTLNGHLYFSPAKHIYMEYNSVDYNILHNFNNGNIGLNAAGLGLYLGHNHTPATYIYYTTADDSVRTKFFEVNSNGAYAPVRFGVNGQSTSYNLYVNGTSYLTNTLYFNGTTYYVNNSGTANLNQLTVNGSSVFKAQIYLNYEQDVGKNQNGSLVIGNKAGENIGIDSNEIMARNNSAVSTLYLNNEGGLVQIGSGGLSVSGLITTGYGIDVWTQSSGANGYTGSGSAIQIREVACVTTNQSAWAYAPKLGFHWGGRYQGTLGLHSNGQFYFGLSGGTNNVTVNTGTLNASGYLTSTLNSNTVTIGSANTSWCHFQNSANISFYFNRSIHVDGSIYVYNTTHHLDSTAIWAYRWRTTNLELAELDANRMGLCNHGQGTAKGLNVGSLLVSSAWADASKVPTNGIWCRGNIVVNGGNTTGGGLILSDDGDIVDLNDAYCSMRFTYGVRIFSANRGGSAIHTLDNRGDVTFTSTGSNRARLFVRSTADVPNDFYLGANNTNQWSITCRSSGESYFLGFYSTTRGWNFRMYHDGNNYNDGELHVSGWVRFPNWTGLYSPNNGAHFYPNNGSSYGAWCMAGSRNGYYGLCLGNSNTYLHVVCDGSGNGGFLAAGVTWPLYYYRSGGRMGLMGSDTSSGWGCQCNTSFYCTSNIHASGNIYIGSSHAGGYLNGSASNGGINSIFLGDDVWLGDCNAAGIMGMKSTSTNTGFYMYNSGGTQTGQLFFNTSECQQRCAGAFKFLTMSGGAQNGMFNAVGCGSSYAGFNLSSYRLHVNGDAYVNGTLWFPAPGQGRICAGNGDGNGNGTANIVIRSWYGIGFVNDCTNVGGYGNITAGVDCRSGYFYAYSYQNRSSILVKENIRDLTEDQAKKILQSRPVCFDYKYEFGGTKNQFGLIAEELELIIPELVIQPADKNGYKNIDYTKIVPYLIKLAQMQQKEIDQLRNELNSLKSNI